MEAEMVPYLREGDGEPPDALSRIQWYMNVYWRIYRDSPASEQERETVFYLEEGD